MKKKNKIILKNKILKQIKERKIEDENLIRKVNVLFEKRFPEKYYFEYENLKIYGNGKIEKLF